jgi:hypothetical protein
MHRPVIALVEIFCQNSLIEDSVFLEYNILYFWFKGGIFCKIELNPLLRWLSRKVTTSGTVELVSEDNDVIAPHLQHVAVDGLQFRQR